MTNYTQPGTPVIEADHQHAPDDKPCKSTHEHEHDGAHFAGAVTYSCTRPAGHDGPHETRGQWLTLARWDDPTGINAKSKGTH